MSSFVKTGINVLKYTDDNGYEMRIVISHIISFHDAGKNKISIDTLKQEHKFMLDNQTAVDNAITLIESSV